MSGRTESPSGGELRIETVSELALQPLCLAQHLDPAACDPRINGIVRILPFQDGIDVNQHVLHDIRLTNRLVPLRARLFPAAALSGAVIEQQRVQGPGRNGFPAACSGPGVTAGHPRQPRAMSP